MTFGRLTVIGITRIDGRLYRVCMCECGATTYARITDLTRGNKKSCGCLNREKSAQRASERNRVHGFTGTKEHEAWMSMWKRCTDPNHAAYANYGGRGITICERWRSFAPFYEDMGCAAPGLSLDRIESDGNYEPGNCRWISMQLQGVNTRNVKLSALEAILIRQISLRGWARDASLARAFDATLGMIGSIRRFDRWENPCRLLLEDIRTRRVAQEGMRLR